MFVSFTPFKNLKEFNLIAIVLKTFTLDILLNKRKGSDVIVSVETYVLANAIPNSNSAYNFNKPTWVDPLLSIKYTLVFLFKIEIIKLSLELFKTAIANFTFKS